MGNVTNSTSAPRDWKEAFASLFSTTGLLLTIVFAAGLILDQLLTDLIQDELLNPRGTSNIIWVYGGLSFFTGLLGPILVSFLALCAWRFPGQSIGEVARVHLSYLIREEMRALGKSLLWSLLLIVPGIVRFFQFAFVPYVVLFDRRYQAGDADALKASWRFVKRVWARLLGLCLLFLVVLPLLMTTLDEWRSVWRRPLTAIPLLFVELTLLVMFQWSVLKTWERAHESDVQVE
jgi:hypothetical protein